MGSGQVTRFEGVVEWIGDGVFGATLVDLDSEEMISADMIRESVHGDDQDRVIVGAMFYWTIDTTAEPPTSVIKFRRPEDPDDPA